MYFIIFLRISMNMYYFGNSLEYIQADYALSNRSTCRVCKQKIDKDTVRLGLILDDDHFNAKYWYHLNCFQLKPRHLQIKEDQIDQKIYNIDNLQENDFQAVIDHIKAELTRLKSGKKATKKQAKKQTKKKGKKQEQSDEESFSVSEQSDSESQSISQSEQSGKKKKKKKSTKVPKTKGKKIQIKGYSTTQMQEFNKLYETYVGKSSNQLKELLAKNKQSKNGTKAQLAQKCADGKLLGQIPTCSTCGGGRLRFDKQTGVYTCPGYMEDTDFIRCNKKFEFDQVKRTEWLE